MEENYVPHTFKDLKQCMNFNTPAKNKYKQSLLDILDELDSDPQYKDYDPGENKDETIKIITRRLLSGILSDKQDTETLTDMLLKEARFRTDMDYLKKAMDEIGV